VPALAKTTNYVYKGDQEAARKLLGLANLQLMKLRNLMAFNNLEQYSLTVYNKVGAYIKVSSIFGMEIAEVYYPKLKGVPEEVIKRKHILRMKTIQDWTLLYAPAPLPDPQDWDGWFDSGKTNLVVDNFLSTFSLIPWGQEVWGDFTVRGDVTPISSGGTYNVTDGGWCLISSSFQPGSPYLYVGPVWQSVGICRKINIHTVQSYEYTFIGDLISAIPVSNWSESGTKGWCYNGGLYDHPEGFVYIPSNPYGVTSPPVTSILNAVDPPPYSPGYTMAHGEGYVSWQSLYMEGFWKQEWTSYNPSSYIDSDNYILFYDKYVWDSVYSSSLLSDTTLPCIHDMYSALYVTPNNYTAQMKSEYLAVLGSGDTNNIDFPNTPGEHNVTIHDPDQNGVYTSRGLITYETHMCGKYEGVWFDEVIGSASWSGSSAWGTAGAWSGDNVFPWMGRIYHKSSLKEGTSDEPDKTSEHNLMLASYLIGAAAGNPSSTDKVPGCEAITSVVYRMRHGATSITETYVASHPGWHTVWTDPATGKLWRAYGDLFAALKATEFKETEIGPPEWIDWWYADGSQFIIEEDDN
jgi:hypothetical protein